MEQLLVPGTSVGIVTNAKDPLKIMSVTSALAGRDLVSPAYGDLIMPEISFVNAVHDALAATPICARLEAEEAVVLERLARGGGATNWYFCRNQSCLGDIERLLSPGSVVSFYFDGRICRATSSTEIGKSIGRLLSSSGEVLAGTPETEGQRISMEIISGPVELEEFLSSLVEGALTFYGLFPARDDDGSGAVTATLPDNDGTVRAHPH